MADFCTDCSLKTFGDECPPEINVDEIFKKLQPNHYVSFMLCEGCGLCAINKNGDGEMQASYAELNESGGLVPSDWEDYPRRNHD